MAVELKTSERTSYSNSMRKKIYSHFLDRGVLLRPLGNILYVVPPYVITGEQLMFIYNEIEEFLNGLK